MKKFITFFSFLFLTSSVLFAGAQQPIGKSLRKTATAGIWNSTFDYYQRTEDFIKLKSSLSIGITPATWGNDLILGFSYDKIGITPVFLLQYAPDYNNTDQESTQDGYNKNIVASDTNYKPLTKTSTSLLKTGIGFNLAGYGLMYVIELNNDLAESEKEEFTINKTNAATLYKKQDVKTIDKTDEGNITHLFEIGKNMGKMLLGDFVPQLQVRLINANGDNEQNYYKEDKIDYNENKDNNVVFKNTLIERKGVLGINSANTLLSNYNLLKYMQYEIAFESKFKVTKNITLYLGEQYSGRNLNEDNAEYEDSTITTTYYTNGSPKGKISDLTDNKIITTFKQDNYLENELYVALKYKKNVTDSVKLGLYPYYIFSYSKIGYSLENEKIDITKGDTSGNGSFENNEVTTAILSGDKDKFEMTTYTHEIRLPIALEWMITKILTLRCGNKIVFKLEKKEISTSDTDSYTTKTDITSAGTTVTDQATEINTSTETSTSYNIDSKNFYFGAGIDVMENLTIDVLSATTTSLDFNSFAVQATYIF